MTPRNLLAIRHAPTLASGICHGQWQAPLLLSHEDAARRMREALGNDSVSCLWTSDLPRCREPASLLARELEVRLEVTSSLREMSMGDWEGRSWADLEREDAERVRHWMASWQTEAPPGGELLEAFEARVRRWHAKLGAEDTVLIAHAGVVRCLQVLRRGLDWSDAMAMEVPHLTLVRL